MRENLSICKPNVNYGVYLYVTALNRVQCTNLLDGRLIEKVHHDEHGAAAPRRHA